MATINFSLILPDALRSMASEITGDTQVEESTTLKANNAFQPDKQAWQYVTVTIGGVQHHVSLVARGSVNNQVSYAVAYSNIQNTDDAIVSLKLPGYINTNGAPVLEKTFTLTGREIIPLIRQHVNAAELNYWVGGRTRVTDIGFRVNYDNAKPYSQSLAGFSISFNSINSADPLWISGMLCRALSCRSLRDRTTHEFNTQFMQPAAIEEQQKEKEA